MILLFMKFMKPGLNFYVSTMVISENMWNPL